MNNVVGTAEIILLMSMNWQKPSVCPSGVNNLCLAVAFSLVPHNY